MSNLQSLALIAVTLSNALSWIFYYHLLKEIRSTHAALYGGIRSLTDNCVFKEKGD